MEIKLSDKPAQPVAFIRLHIPQAKLPQTIGETYMKIMEYLQRVKSPLAGEPYVAYYNIDMNDLDVEMGFPVAAPVQAHDDMNFREIPAARYASTVYKGPYAGMETAYGEFMKWLEETGLKPAGPWFEYYLNSPQEVPESEFLTRIEVPVE
ncbi:GyrI-like domain-containing protein [Dehalogenimonas etheniformans]|uniref:AraC family transcriptional regulator n=1 Tax=Dehalogenimonas etheniformans TaxID=1536648 RepID=A0A2P5P6F8_9CHLR|nr:GyrI-like domain-containing protein [Dehalogenimonas etheniformans]PPD57875.1 AraC family transcriptional regulator [Dehalogenimonas etheniformans]QNT75472.1 GyrI-like domain-containing protein [Dehalogenimonas etheniformans]